MDEKMVLSFAVYWAAFINRLTDREAGQLLKRSLLFMGTGMEPKFRRERLRFLWMAVFGPAFQDQRQAQMEAVERVQGGLDRPSRSGG